MRVVLVEPSRVGLKVMTGLLEERGHVVLPFQDGAEALDQVIRDSSVEIVLTSFELHGLSGLELCWEARALANAEQRALHVIVMSSNRDWDKLVEALDSGADDFIGKPPNGEELFARLRSAERILNAQRELIRLATVDPLTGLFNRRAFFEKASRICAEAAPDRPVAALMFDIDHFKRVNDGFGHDVGDMTIRRVAGLAADLPGVSGRLGGEEFACVLEGTDAHAARALAERLRTAALEATVDTGTMLLSVTISVGVAGLTEPGDIDTLLKRADIALYAAKTGGRNRVEVSSACDGAGEPVASLVRRRARGA